MQFVSTRIITADIHRLITFYEKVAGAPLTKLTEDFAELRTSAGTLAIASVRTLQFFGGDVARPAENHSLIIDFMVQDVDSDHQRLAPLLADCLVQLPTTMPWGNRSLLFRDPDGNLVNLFTPVTPQARAKFAR